MATIDVEGQKIDVPDDATPAELDAIAQEHSKPAASPVADFAKSTALKTAEGLPVIGPAITAASHLGDIAKGAGMAVQGTRAIGVGTQHLIQGEGPAVALDRAAAAAAPGFTAKPGERLGSFIGSAVPLLAAPGGLAGAAAVSGLASGGEKRSEGASLKDAALTGAGNAALTYVGGKIFEGVAAPILKGAYRGVVGLVKGTGRKVVDLVFDAASTAPKSVQEAGAAFFARLQDFAKGAEIVMANAKALPERPSHSFAEAASNLPTGTPDVAGVSDDAVKFAQALQEHVYAGAESAQRTLTGETNAVPLIKELNGLIERLYSKRLQGAPEADKAAAALTKWTDMIKSRTDLGGKVPEETLKKVLRSLDDAAAGSESTDVLVVNQLRKARRAIDNHLKVGNKAYESAMEPVAAALSQLEKLKDALGLKTARGGVLYATDKTGASLLSLAKGGKLASQDVVSEAGFSGVKKLSEEQAKAAAKEAAVKTGQKLDVQAVQAFGKAKGEAVSAAESLRPKEVSLGDLRQATEGAAKAGVGSPAHQKLVELIDSILPGRGRELSQQMMEGAANEVLGRGRATGVVKGAFGEITPSHKVLRGADRLLSGVRRLSRPARSTASPLLRSLNGEDQ